MNVLEFLLLKSCSVNILNTEEVNPGPVFAAFSAVLQGSLFGMVGLFPPRYSTLFMSGQGLAGIFAALAMLLSILSK